MAEEIETTSETPPTEVAAAGRSMDEILQDPLVAAPAARHRDAILSAKEFANEITLTIVSSHVREVCRSFKEDGFTYLVDLTGVDYQEYPGHTGDRFAISYHLYSFRKNARVRLKTFVGEDAMVPSVADVWKTANWHERETFDMYGILFDGHPNLERILMWEGFNGHPLRKDFPIRGIETGARIYPEVFPEGGGPRAGSTGKDVNDVNIYRGEWTDYGRWPLLQARAESPGQSPPAPELAGEVAPTAQPTPDAPFHDPDIPLNERMQMAKEGDLKMKLFAAMAQTDCTACGWDCEGYAEAIATGETNDLTLCVPGEDETESMLKQLMGVK
jgi:NADH-quinone oxidoreductase subunit C